MSREKIINNMCMTFRHDYGLLEESEGNALFNQMAQIFDNDISYHLMTQADVEDYEERAEALEEELKEKQNGINKLMKDCIDLEKDRDYWKTSFNKQVEASRNV